MIPGVGAADITKLKANGYFTVAVCSDFLSAQRMLNIIFSLFILLPERRC
jgi:hypothetical protein